MSKNLINIGDSVVFAQHYLPEHEFHQLYGMKGAVLSTQNDKATVLFKEMRDPISVNKTDLEHYIETETDIDIFSSSIPLIEDQGDIGGMNRAQLISEKLWAQEFDPGLNKEINQVMNQFQ